MTREDFDGINKRRLARGQQPLTYVESPRRIPPPLDTAAARVKAATAGEATTPDNSKAHRQPSHLEAKFLHLWNEAGGPSLEKEFRFHKTRRWRADFAHQASLTLFEVDGGVWGGRHVHGSGFMGDCEKHLAAYEAGWTVVRFSPRDLTADRMKGVVARTALRAAFPA